MTPHCYCRERATSLRNHLSFLTFEKLTSFLSLSPMSLESYIINENSPYEFNSNKIRDAQNRRSLIWAGLRSCFTDRKTESQPEGPIDITQKSGQQPKFPDFQPRAGSTSCLWPLVLEAEGMWGSFVSVLCFITDSSSARNTFPL